MSRHSASQYYGASIYLEEEEEGDSSFDRIYNEASDDGGLQSTSDEFYLDADKEGTTAHSSSEDTDEVTSPRSNRSKRPTSPPRRQYSVTELVHTLGHESTTSQLSPELQRRVLDFRLAQHKRRDKYGERKRWGIFGLYSHLSNVRTDLEWAEDAAWRRAHGAPYLSWGDFDKSHKIHWTGRPWFTYFLVFVCSIMMIVEFGLNDWKVEPLNINPLIGPSAETLVRAGARDTIKIVEGGQWFRIFTPLVLHAGLIHYFVNMGALWFIGAAIEQSHGIVNTILLFLIPGVGGNILSALFLPQYISVGASGGIFGFVGGCIADITLNWRLLFIKTGAVDDRQNFRRNVNAIVWLFVDIVINVLIGLTPFVDNFSHLGGLVYGLLCGWSTLEPLAVGFFGVATTSLEKVKILLVRFFGVIVSVVAIMVTTALLASYDVGSTPCHGCRYISCVPFPFFREDKWWHCDDCDMVTADLYKNGEIYSRIDLTCPNQDVEQIDISAYSFTNRDDIRHELPSYCREHCSDRFN